ncbi:MbtH family NRPS accessory protein [Streptomyces sp. NPDC001985]|uniref:MbtH family NRPS accessory protein n=1 Tax=Streptomyces sp. NPDC001985 TaxID=3154406 RepID=UPI00332D22D0
MNGGEERSFCHQAVHIPTGWTAIHAEDSRHGCLDFVERRPVRKEAARSCIRRFRWPNRQFFRSCSSPWWGWCRGLWLWSVLGLVCLMGW